jgi:hypothetical protein
VPSGVAPRRSARERRCAGNLCEILTSGVLFAGNREADTNKLKSKQRLKNVLRDTGILRMAPDLQCRRHPLFPENLKDAFGVRRLSSKTCRRVNLYGDHPVGSGELRRLGFWGQRFSHELNPGFDRNC